MNPIRREHIAHQMEANWKTMQQKDPEWIEMYFGICEGILKDFLQLPGSSFKRLVLARGGDYSKKVSGHNYWVTAVRQLQLMGWIRPAASIEPPIKDRHSHIDAVTLWDSMLHKNRASLDRIALIRKQIRGSEQGQ